MRQIIRANTKKYVELDEKSGVTSLQCTVPYAGNLTNFLNDCIVSDVNESKFLLELIKR